MLQKRSLGIHDSIAEELFPQGMDGDGSAIRMVRGHPRAPFERWFSRHKDSRASDGGRSISKKDVVAVDATPLVAQPRAGPAAHAKACARVKQLQNAIDALDEKDTLVARRFSNGNGSENWWQGRSWRLHRRMFGMERPCWSARGGCSGCLPSTVVSSVNEELERLRGLVAELMRPKGRSTTLSEPGRVANSDVVAHECPSWQHSQARTLAAPSLDSVPMNQIVASSSQQQWIWRVPKTVNAGWSL